MNIDNILVAIIIISTIGIIIIIKTSIKKKFVRKEDYLDNIIIKNKEYEKKQYKNLLNLVNGNNEEAERRINIEQGITPKENRIKLIKSAILRIEMFGR